MKIGIRKPSPKKSFKARTTGKMKRAVKKAVIPGYGKKGTGWIKNPKKAAYNKVYSKTTVGLSDLATPTKQKKKRGNSAKTASTDGVSYSWPLSSILKAVGLGFGILLLIGFIGSIFTPDPEAITISIPDYQGEYDINTDIPIEISVEPENAGTSSLKYETDSGFIEFSKDGIHTKDQEGTYEIFVSSGDIESNTISITVVDMAARAEAERLAEEEWLAEEKRAEEERLAEEKRLAEETAAQEAEEKRLAEEQKQAEELAAQEAALAAEEERIAQEAMAAQSENDGSGGGNSQEPSGGNSNFNTHDNPEQQQTSASYVLNTSTGKFHNPSCKSVAKIAPQNYATSNSSRDELIAQGYSPCGNCHP